MIEENYVRLYAMDFARMAKRPIVAPHDDPALAKRIAEARSHAELMDARKGSGHLAALVSRLRDEARRPETSNRLASSDHPEAMGREHQFLNDVADRLNERGDPPYFSE